MLADSGEPNPRSRAASWPTDADARAPFRFAEPPRVRRGRAGLVPQSNAASLSAAFYIPDDDEQKIALLYNSVIRDVIDDDDWVWVGSGSGWAEKKSRKRAQVGRMVSVLTSWQRIVTSSVTV